jgi:hypothetical protein
MDDILKAVLLAGGFLGFIYGGSWVLTKIQHGRIGGKIARFFDGDVSDYLPPDR